MYKMCKSNTYFVLLNLTNKIKRGRTVSRISQKTNAFDDIDFDIRRI